MLLSSARIIAAKNMPNQATRASSTASAVLMPAADILMTRSFTRDYAQVRRALNQDADARADLAYCLSFANDESDFETNFARLFPDERMKEQLKISKNQLKAYQTIKPVSPNVLDTDPLPKTLQDAIRQTSRAIVITEANKPFRVFDVNRTWENLCGYSFLESKDKTLGSLLKGPETNQVAATSLITQLLRGEEAGATLTNYTKSGRRFRNRIRVGPIVDEKNEVTHFVGVLQEIQDGM